MGVADFDPIFNGIEDLLFSVIVKQTSNRKKRQVEDDDFGQHFVIDENSGRCFITEKELEEILELLESAKAKAKGCPRSTQEAKILLQYSREVEKKQECADSVQSLKEMMADIQKLYRELNEFVPSEINSYDTPEVSKWNRMAKKRLQRKLETKMLRVTVELNKTMSSLTPEANNNNSFVEDNSINGRCSQLINNVIKGLKDVKESFQNLSDSMKSTVDIRKEAELKSVYEENVKKLKRNFDDLSATLGEKEVIFNELEKKYNEKVIELKATLQKLEKERHLHAETRVLLEKGKENTLESYCASICRTPRWWWNNTIKAEGNLMCAFMRNEYYNEYLFVGEDKQKHDESNHNVFTRIGFDPLGHPCCWEHSQGLWILTIGSDGKITIKTSYHQYGNELQMLYGVSDEESSKWRREVYTWRGAARTVPGTKDWQLVPTSTRTRMQIQLGNGEFLYAPKSFYAYDKQRRTLFTWRDLKSDPSEWLGIGDWIVDMATCPGHVAADISPK